MFISRLSTIVTPPPKCNKLEAKRVCYSRLFQIKKQKKNENTTGVGRWGDKAEYNLQTKQDYPFHHNSVLIGSKEQKILRLR